MSRIDLTSLRNALDGRPPRRVSVVPPLREAAVAIVLVPEADSDVALLLIKRAEHPEDPWSGQMALPGGRHEAGDADLMATAIRETVEETGVRLTASDRLGELDDLSPVSPHLPPIVVRPFVFALPAVPPIRLSDEVAEYLWVPRRLLVGQRSDETVRVRDRTLDVPGYRVGPHFIWGMTERIITPLLQLLGQ